MKTCTLKATYGSSAESHGFSISICIPVCWLDGISGFVSSCAVWHRRTIKQPRRRRLTLMTGSGRPTPVASLMMRWVSHGTRWWISWKFVVSKDFFTFFPNWQVSVCLIQLSRWMNSGWSIFSDGRPVARPEAGRSSSTTSCQALAFWDKTRRLETAPDSFLYKNVEKRWIGLKNQGCNQVIWVWWDEIFTSLELLSHEELLKWVAYWLGSSLFGIGGLTTNQRWTWVHIQDPQKWLCCHPQSSVSCCYAVMLLCFILDIHDYMIFVFLLFDVQRYSGFDFDLHPVQLPMSQLHIDDESLGTPCPMILFPPWFRITWVSLWLMIRLVFLHRDWGSGVKHEPFYVAIITPASWTYRHPERQSQQGVTKPLKMLLTGAKPLQGGSLPYFHGWQVEIDQLWRVVNDPWWPWGLQVSQECYCSHFPWWPALDTMCETSWAVDPQMLIEIVFVYYSEHKLFFFGATIGTLYTVTLSWWKHKISFIGVRYGAKASLGYTIWVYAHVDLPNWSKLCIVPQKEHFLQV